jgi:hypothetical protein
VIKSGESQSGGADEVKAMDAVEDVTALNAQPINTDKLGLYKAKGDGHCLFDCIAEAVGLHSPGAPRHSTMRSIIVDHAKKVEAVMVAFLDDEFESWKEVMGDANNIQTSERLGGHNELIIAADKYNFAFCIYDTTPMHEHWYVEGRERVTKYYIFIWSGDRTHYDLLSSNGRYQHSISDEEKKKIQVFCTSELTSSS